MRRVFLSTNGDGVTRAQEKGAGDWEVERSLVGIDIRSLAVDPLDPETVYAGSTQGQGIFRSKNAGSTWQEAGLEGMIIKSLSVSPHRSGALLAGCKPASVYHSNDCGGSWEELRGFQRIPGKRWWFTPAETPPQAYVQALAFSPSDPEMLLAGVEFGAVVRSTDGGRSWSKHRKGALRDCHTLVTHASNGDWAYEAGGTGGGAAVSRDGGQTWQRPKDGVDRPYGWSVAADPQRPEVWYFSAAPQASLFSFPPIPPAHVDGQANAAIYRCIGTGSCEKLSGGLPEPLDFMAYTLLTDPHNPGHVYAGMSDGDVWHSQDHGDVWTKLPVNLGHIWRTLVLTWVA